MYKTILFGSLLCLALSCTSDPHAVVVKGNFPDELCSIWINSESVTVKRGRFYYRDTLEEARFVNIGIAWQDGREDFVFNSHMYLQPGQSTRLKLSLIHI